MCVRRLSVNPVRGLYMIREKTSTSAAPGASPAGGGGAGRIAVGGGRRRHDAVRPHVRDGRAVGGPRVVLDREISQPRVRAEDGHEEPALLGTNVVDPDAGVRPGIIPECQR